MTKRPYPYCPYFRKHRKRMYPTYTIALHHTFDGMHVFECTADRLAQHYHVGHDRSQRISRLPGNQGEP